MSGQAFTAAPVTVRPVDASDLSAIGTIEGAHGNLRSWPARPDFLDHEFELARMVVAELLGEVVGFAGAFEYEDLTQYSATGSS